MAKVFRVRPHDEGGPCAVRRPDTGEMDVPNPAAEFPADDPLVVAYPWLFRQSSADDASPDDTETTTRRKRTTTSRSSETK
jgi:hypothetical protein